jgi:hypothetical protein
MLRFGGAFFVQLAGISIHGCLLGRSHLPERIGKHRGDGLLGALPHGVVILGEIVAQPLRRSLHNCVDDGGNLCVHDVALRRSPSKLQSRCAPSGPAAKNALSHSHHASDQRSPDYPHDHLICANLSHSRRL